MLVSWVPPRTVTTFLPASWGSAVMPLPARTMTFEPVTKWVSAKSTCDSRSLLWVSVAASTSTWPCCSSGIRLDTDICLKRGVTPIFFATAVAMSIS